MIRQAAALARDDRGGTYGEFLIVILPVLAFGLGIFQIAQLYTAKMAVDHAAANAARAASVVFADDPRFYDNEPVHQEGDKRNAAVRMAALRTVAPYVLDGSLRTVEVRFPNGIPRTRGAAMTVEVEAKFRCSVPLVHRVVCRDEGGTITLGSRQTLASQAASFSYGSGSSGPLSSVR